MQYRIAAARNRLARGGRVVLELIELFRMCFVIPPGTICTSEIEKIRNKKNNRKYIRFSTRVCYSPQLHSHPGIHIAPA